jgi:ubiquinone/menaquinone biosynthesis C-methylase UbiE
VSKDYNAQVAVHYSKYRPPLHEIILSKAMDKGKRFDVGLDIGCGTGKSSKPLSKFCGKVFGIDPSQSMIENAERDPSITYICGDEDTLAQFQSNQFDVVTFAGSLFYAKNNTLRHELKRICRDEASIFIYDFEVLLSDFWREIGLKLSAVDSSGYNHSLNISDWKEFEEKIVREEQIDLSPTAEELAHLILAHSTWHDELVMLFGDKDPFVQLVNYLRSKGENFRLPVNIFYSGYRVSNIKSQQL